MEKDKWLDDTLISLKRTYGKDEYISALLKQISEKDIEIGKLKSEIQHLNSLSDLTPKERKALKAISVAESQKEEAYIKIKKENKKLQLDIERYREANNTLLSRMAVQKSNLSNIRLQSLT